MLLNDHFEWGSRCYLMGILNVTPDSFSGDGVLGQRDPISVAVDQACTFFHFGADMIDIGGESTRPGATPVGVSEEIDRVVPVIEAVTSALPECMISIDTSKAEVAAAALIAGADIINDIWALRHDKNIAGVAADAKAPVILMHNASCASRVEKLEKGGAQYTPRSYNHLLNEVCSELSTSAHRAEASGIPADQIILDPGVGFGKSPSQNLALINHLDRIRALGYPVLVGPSRKSFISSVLGVEAECREEGTAAAIAAAVIRGADIVRVHDVTVMKRIVDMCNAIIRASEDGSISPERVA